MVFAGKKLSDINEEDIKRLVTDQVQEKDTVEFKKEMYGGSDGEKREMLKDITSMANHRGGYLLIGVEENGDGIAINIIGIDPSNHVEKITSCCLDNIDKRIVGLEVKDISLENGKVATVISIPESLNAPHMVTHTGLNQFWKRHGRQKDKMTIDEIGEAFDKRLVSLNRLDKFLFTRRADILEDIGEKTFMIVTASPSYLRDEVILSNRDENLRAIIQNPPRVATSHGIFSGSPYVTVNGLRADGNNPFYRNDRLVEQYVEVFANGYMELGVLLTGEGQHGVVLRSLTEPLLAIDFIAFVGKIAEQYLPFIPLTITLSILNAKGLWLVTGRRIDEESRVRWQRQHLELGKFYTENIASERKMLTKHICDRLWQSFHREKCNLFDDAGTYRQPRDY